MRKNSQKSHTQLIVIVAMLVLLLTNVAGTYAWQSITQRAQNENMSMTFDHNVQLLKLEKTQEGQATDNPIANVRFSLYKEKGETAELIGSYITNALGSLYANLEPGSYFFREDAPPEGYTLDVDEKGNTIRDYAFVIDEDQNDVQVLRVYNISQVASLTITKTVKNGDGTALTQEQKNLRFSFRVTFENGRAYDYVIKNEQGTVLFSGKMLSGGLLNLGHGQRAVIDNLPVGLSYTVSEIPREEYSVNSLGDSGSITVAGVTAAFTNIYGGNVVEVDPPLIRKLYTGDAPPDTTFAFQLKGENGAPMPAGSVGDTKTVNITTNGVQAVELGVIKYDTPGTYVYRISEVVGDAIGWKYDTTVYTLSVTVKKQPDGTLTAERKLEQVGASRTDYEAKFTNDYDKDRVWIRGVKTWEHGTNPKSSHPSSIVVLIYGDGKQVSQIRVDESSNWTYETSLPRYAAADGHQIVYTVGEQPVIGYKASITGYNIKNTYIGSITPAPGTSDDPDMPKMGDESNSSLWLALMIISAVVILVTLYFIFMWKPRYKGKYAKKRGAKKFKGPNNDKIE